MTIRTKLAFLFVAAAVGVAAVVYVNDRPDPAVMVASADAPPPKLRSKNPDPAPLATENAASASPPPAGTRSTLSLLNEMNRATNLRAFAEKAKFEPGRGGLYYAVQINNRCWAAQEVIRSSTNHAAARLQEPPELTLKRSVALDRLKALCNDFLGTELSISEAALLMQSQAAAADPLLRISKALMSNNSQSNGDYINALRNLLEEANPLAFVDQTFGLTKDGYYFEGEYFPIGRNGAASLYMAAKALTACDLGDTCDQSDFRLLIPCIQQGICVNSRARLVAVMLSQSSKDPGGDYQRIDDLRSRMTTAVRQLNVAAFQPAI